MGPIRLPGRWAHAAVMLGLAGLAAAVLWWRWVGYQGHNDAYYAWAAMDWAEHAPVLATVDLGAYAALLLMGCAAARRWLGARRGCWAARWVPPGILRKIEQPGRALVAYRTPAP